MINAVDLFCGIGGLTHGLEKSGISVNAGIDIDTTCKFAYEENNNAKFIEMDIKKADKSYFEKYLPKESITLLAGCAPCQPFSSLSRTVSKEKKLDKWFLLEEFARLVKELTPDLVTMENVPDLKKEEVFLSFVSTLESLNYHVVFDNLYCPDYGLPQNRTRLVLMASKLGEICLPQKTHTPDNYVTLREAIGHLPSIEAGRSDENDPIHRSSGLSRLNFERIKQSKPGGTWRDWDPSIVAPCHQKESGQTYSSVYGRLEWDKISSTITTQFNGFGNGRFGHPVQHRALSLREGAILQSFPDDYVFLQEGEELKIRHLARHIGNAVPVILGEIIGNTFIQHIKELQYGRKITI